MREISIQFEIYLCITIFSREKDNYFNKALIINPNGEIVQKYNKKNIPPKNVIKRNTILINQRIALSFLISGNLELAY